MSSVRYAIQIGNVLYEGIEFFEGCAAARADLPMECNPYMERNPWNGGKETEPFRNWNRGWLAQTSLLQLDAQRIVRGETK